MRLIDADAYQFSGDLIYEPTIDAVEVVRCKDCKHRHSSEFCECREPDAFCSDGERMETT